MQEKQIVESVRATSAFFYYRFNHTWVTRKMIKKKTKIKNHLTVG